MLRSRTPPVYSKGDGGPRVHPQNACVKLKGPLQQVSEHQNYQNDLHLSTMQ